jgi:hypothetical protein
MWLWVVNAKPRPLYPSGKTRYPPYRRLGGSPGRSGQVPKSTPPPGFDPRAVQPVASVTSLEVSLMFCPSSFCLLTCSCLVFSVNYYGTFCLHFAKQFLLYSCILSKTVVTFSSFVISLFLYHVSKCILPVFSYISSLFFI